MESPIVAAGSHGVGRGDVELALGTLYSCVLNRKADDAGEDSYGKVVHWLKGRKGSKEVRKRASYLVQRYETLRKEF
jgi:hypothetical protein